MPSLHGETRGLEVLPMSWVIYPACSAGSSPVQKGGPRKYKYNLSFSAGPANHCFTFVAKPPQRILISKRISSPRVGYSHD